MIHPPLTLEKNHIAIPSRLKDRSLVLVGLMGAGKTTVGRALATALDLPFVDSDHEIEKAAGVSVNVIFQDYGEAYFRSGEQRVIARLLQDGPQVLATGGGAFMDAQTREAIKAKGISLWLKTPLPVLLKRLKNRKNRPLLQHDTFEETLRNLMDVRYPVYALADIHVESATSYLPDVSRDALEKISEYLSGSGVEHLSER